MTKDMFYLGTEDNLLLYHILCLARKYMYDAKTNSKTPDWDAFMYFLKYIKTVEFQIAQTNNKMTKCIEKWRLIA